LSVCQVPRGTLDTSFLARRTGFDYSKAMATQVFVMNEYGALQSQKSYSSIRFLFSRWDAELMECCSDGGFEGASCTIWWNASYNRQKRRPLR